MKKEIIWSNESDPLKFCPQEGIFKKEKEVDEDGEELLNFEDVQEKLQIKKIMQTSLGNFVLEDELSPIRHLQFWRADCNFNITEPIQNELDLIDGIEILRVLTRYAFVIAVGKAFQFRDIRMTIDEKLCGNTVSTSQEDEELTKLKQELAPFKNWCIYRLPNGNLDYTWLEPDNSNAENFLDKVKLFTSAQKISNGQLIRSE